ncbi:MULTISPECIES: glutathione S-transferase family protein [Acinetobacter calcoaceticus/baumannii complex]|uniref:glutathione S-transferase family protein n=1 Tax=Acinetobacter calcoaceticus/baumannii complex TaxID=909768 RepID=UPI000449ACB6|nr:MULTISPECIES: glutathione S-transferase [Acinetobacter calcoaceticus/baumannii complex]EXS33380.1 glutathione S-transferase, C-terminal domain protein [Acinetobacter sp. 826659]MCH2072199.1 glutathione S-transferase [Acinetobacter pittii]MDQ9887333.1 glutathione S-transferase [Acinetobacter pittii]PTV44745.1 glutathione S-transferase [Acinetobacter pittii]RZH13825.1 glutathione S-transferase [Acinetobacter pittii]
MSIILHHLNASRSFRILWLLEEINQPYELKSYFRDKTTNLAPQELKNIHPLGKSPVIELNGKVIAESGAIVEILIEKFAPQLMPAKDSDSYLDYLQWVHFSESSAMVPYLLNIFNSIELKNGTQLKFLDQYAQTELDKVFSYLDQQLVGKKFLVGDCLTGADFMIGFVVYGLINSLNIRSKYLNIEQYVKGLENLESWKKAMSIEQNLHQQTNA